MKKAIYSVLAACVGFLVLPWSAAAQNYPDRPVRVIIVFPPGGSNDVTGRIVFQKMNEITGQQFIIDNRGGAAGSIGSDIVAKGPKDGYTIMVQSTTHVANAHLYKKLPYDVLKDFIGITPMARQVGMLVVHPALPVKSGKEFIALAKSKPGQLNYASAGSGNPNHLAAELLNMMAGIKMQHIPYKGGGPAVTDLVGGQVQLFFSTPIAVMSHIKSGKVKAIASTRETRSPAAESRSTIRWSSPGTWSR